MRHHRYESDYFGKMITTPTGTWLSPRSTSHIATLLLISILTMAGSMIAVVHGAFAPLMLDNIQIRNDVPGVLKPSPRSWADSYSYNNSCYCNTTYDHGLATVMVVTPLGNLSIRDVCTLLGTGPTGTNVGRPLYNDIQCGNGPSVIADEVTCPGRTEHGQEGCKYIGPKWNFAAPIPPGTAPVTAPMRATTPTTATAPVKATSPTTTATKTKAPSKVPTTTTETTTNIGFLQWIVQQFVAIVTALFGIRE